MFCAFKALIIVSATFLNMTHDELQDTDQNCLSLMVTFSNFSREMRRRALAYFCLHLIFSQQIYQHKQFEMSRALFLDSLANLV